MIMSLNQFLFWVAPPMWMDERLQQNRRGLEHEIQGRTNPAILLVVYNVINLLIGPLLGQPKT